MRFRLAVLVLCLSSVAGTIAGAQKDDVAGLRLVPFPKKVALRRVDGQFDLDRPLVLEVPAGHGELAGRLIVEEMKRAGLPEPKVEHPDKFPQSIRLLTNPRATRSEAPLEYGKHGELPESYWLQIDSNTIEMGARKPEGLFYAAQTLLQLIRANRVEKTKLPCLRIVDWPSLTWRCFQDDMTRGPSSTLATLRREVALGAFFKMNLFTYYMEYQYRFRKHPKIGPPNGSLEPEDLKALVETAMAYHVDVLGNQQSFGHFERILQHEEYAELRESPRVLCPVKEATYRLLDDLYSEVCPLLPFEMFNVCCDETWDLGTGPSKQRAEEIGTGGVYVEHIRRVHDLLKTKYNKRMMMWGDIILKHPDKLDQIPKDTVMLTWGYGAKDSFEDQIIPFAESGYEFFVCPGISNWSRILPDFGVATTNIRNFVRDGVKHGAIGMLNTAWEDDGEALQGYRWHGFAWGAECAWNASATEPEDFNRRIGAVLFGESGDEFGQAIELLAQTHRMPGMEGMKNKRFWQEDFPPQGKPGSLYKSARELSRVTGKAIRHLEACRKGATVNADFLDAFLFGAKRMEFIAQRNHLDFAVPVWYLNAYNFKDTAHLARARVGIQHCRDRYADLAKEFRRLWLAESKPYALDWTLDRYAKRTGKCDELLARLADAQKDIAAGREPPAPKELGLDLPEKYQRRDSPHKTLNELLEPQAAWTDPAASHRLGLTVAAGTAQRYELPIEFDAPLVRGLQTMPVRAFCRVDEGPSEEIPVQAVRIPRTSSARFALLIPGPIPQGGRASIHIYLGLPKVPKPLSSAVRVCDGPNGAKWIENDKVRLLLGPEGAHLYRWEVKGLDNRDLTQPGEKDWSGFADVGHGHRNLPNKLTCTASGPAMVQYKCRDEAGQVRKVNLFAGASWMEVVLDEPVTYYWDFDNPENFAADGPTPGEYLFSNGKTGLVGRQADGVSAQVAAEGVRWAVKYNKQGLALGVIAPETPARFVVAPGAGAGGVGIERSPAAGHFITYAGLATEPKQQMERLCRTLDFANQPEVVLYAIEARSAPGKAISPEWDELPPEPPMFDDTDDDR